MSSLSYGQPENDREMDAMAKVTSLSFGHPAEAIRERIGTLDRDTLRVLRDGQDVVGCFWFVPMGQWFGGRPVPMSGIAAVGVAPDRRGQGIALDLMQRAMRELNEAGVPISSLYPATQTLYRKAGFEQAGSRHHYTLKPGDIRIRDRDLTAREAVEGDREAVQAVYRKHAAGFDGHLDRGAYVWDRIFEFRNQKASGYVVEEGGEIRGYVYYLTHARDQGGFDLQLTDIAALDSCAGRNLWSLLHDYRSMSPEMSWYGGPTSMLLPLLAEQPWKSGQQMYWMTRIVNVPKALEARGYSRGLAASLSLEIQDAGVPSNHDRFTVEIADGAARVTRGGKGALRMDVRGLAPLFSGLYPPRALRAAGLLEGDDAEIDKACGVFSHGAPGMPDMF